MNFVSWNCRGLGNSSKVEPVNDLIRMASPDVLMLQETKIDEDSILSISSKRWKTNVGKVVSARGIAGGITTLWKENVFSMETPTHHSTGSSQNFGILQVKNRFAFLTFMCMSIPREKETIGARWQPFLMLILFQI